ncbi:uncharacterized protein BJX67DRAFT_382326 [Aspergillus lucknowensis]|uniref:Uncharacterized protein n=1 Tax=Aspergillus lucknowensis TaxID=176173 RepID=A0ABR4LN40_9EURO
MRFTDISVSTLALWALRIRNAAAAEGAWLVEISTDEFCEDTTGWYADDAGTGCFSFDGLPDIKSATAEGDTIGSRCGFSIAFYENYDCSGAMWYLMDGQCFAAPLKSFEVQENPCV